MYKTIEEIYAEFNGQWVYLVNLLKDNSGTILGGEVFAHSESRDKVLAEIIKNPDKGIYSFYAGQIPEGVGVIL